MAEPEILGARSLPHVDRLRTEARALEEFDAYGGGVLRMQTDIRAGAKLIVQLHNALTRLLATINVRDAETHAPNCGCVIHEARAALANARADQPIHPD